MPKFFCLIIVFSLLAVIFLYKPQETPKPGFLLEPTPSIVVPVDDPSQKIIFNINKRNKQIKTFGCDVKISIQGRFLVRATADIKYEKMRKLRMLVNSIAGKEMDIGSNDTMFWFWSKRLQPCALYYSTYANIKNAGMKTPFSPVFLKSVLGFDEIEMKGASVCRRGANLQITQKTTNSSEEPVTRITIVDPVGMTIIGHYIYQNGRVVCSAEVFEQSEGGLPARIILHWNEENITMIWSLSNQIVNSKMDNGNFVMPSARQKVNLGKGI